MTPESSLDQLSVIPPRSRAEQLADTLARHIADRGLRPGDRMGTLEEIRAEVGFAKSTISEAVRLLRERGVLEIRPGRGGGLFVSPQTPVVRMRHTLLRTTGEDVSVRDAIELRESLEEPIARAAARACTAADATRLRALAAEMHTCGGDFAEFMRRNWALHEAVAALCPNAMMAAVYGSCLGYLTRSAASYGEGEEAAEYIEARARVHDDLVEAIVRADPAAIAAAVAAHNGTASGSTSR